MASNPIDLPSATAAGFAALKMGDANAARACFDRFVSAGAADAAVWYGLSLVNRSLGASAEENSALDQALALDPRHLPALIAKGDWFSRSGDRRAANSYYRAVIKLAAVTPSLPPDWRADIQRVEAASQRFARDYEEHLLAALTAGGLGGPGTERFAHAVDLLLGKREIYYQQPKYFFFPGLPHTQFFDRRQFPWAGALERASEGIIAEVRAIVEAGTGVVPYIQRETNRPAFDVRGLLDNPDWSAFYLIRDGTTLADNAARCPRTLAAISELPLCRIDGRTPSVLFSLLRPGARIPPHTGQMNTRLICHLPLIVPDGCALRVGNETRPWMEGQTLIFDDTIEHEAWNTSEQLRVVLLFDIWRPELSLDERDLVAAMLAAVDSYGTAP